MFWIVGASEGSYYSVPTFSILDDEDNVVEECTLEQVNNYADSGLKIEYKEGSIKEKNKWIGKKTWDGYPVLCKVDAKGHHCILKDSHIVQTNIFTQEQYIRSVWNNMKIRCTKATINGHHKSYLIKGIYIDESFRNFDNFYNWYISQPNFKYLKEANLQIDKDLKGKGYYGVDSCILLPGSINAKLSAINHIKTSSLPRFCHEASNHVYVAVNTMNITDEMKDTSCKSAFYENLVIDFLDSRNITEWKYTNSMEDVGRMWVTAKNISFSSNKELCDQSLQKGWITKDYYDRLIDVFDVKITDWSIYEDCQY